MAEFTFNSSVNRSSSYNPFEIVYGNNPSSVSDLIALPMPKRVHPKVEDMANVMQQVHQQVKIKLEATNAKYKVAVDLHSKHVVFEVGDIVWVLISKDRRPKG